MDAWRHASYKIVKYNIQGRNKLYNINLKKYRQKYNDIENNIYKYTQDSDNIVIIVLHYS